MIRLVAWLMLALVAGGCRGFHEIAIRQRLVETRFFSRDVPQALVDVDAFLISRKAEGLQTWCELCVTSAESLPDGSRKYCLSSGDESSCFIARAKDAKLTRFEPVPGERLSTQVVRMLWSTLEPEVYGKAELADLEEIDVLAEEEERSFVPKWTFVAGAKVGSVVSYEAPAFTFGGQVGFRYWGSLFVIPGAVIEVENMLQTERSMITSSVLARVELALWTPANADYLNLPSISFLMGAGPLLGFGRTPALGGRAVMGVHLAHLGRFYTPFFFELGFQALEVDEHATTGLRVALGLGF